MLWQSGVWLSVGAYYSAEKYKRRINSLIEKTPVGSGTCNSF